MTPGGGGTQLLTEKFSGPGPPRAVRALKVVSHGGKTSDTEAKVIGGDARDLKIVCHGGKAKEMSPRLPTRDRRRPRGAREHSPHLVHAPRELPSWQG